MSSIYEKTESSRGVIDGGWMFPDQSRNDGTEGEPIWVPTGGLIATYDTDHYDILPMTYATWAGTNPPLITFKVMRPTEIQFVAKAFASAATTGTITFKLTGRVDESDPWSTDTEFTVALTLNGTTPVVTYVEQSVKAWAEIKLVSIETTSTAAMLEGINLKVSWKV